MKNALQIIAAVVVIAVLSYVGYITYQDQIRKKELDKKLSDNLSDQKDINKLIKEKLENGTLNIMIPERVNGYNFSSNGKDKKRKVNPSTDGKKDGK